MYDVNDLLYIMRHSKLFALWIESERNPWDFLLTRTQPPNVEDIQWARNTILKLTKEQEKE
jgi:hypothetical protein